MPAAMSSALQMIRLNFKKLDICLDTQLVVNQLVGSYQSRDSKMTSYLAHVKNMQSTFEVFNITHVLRSKGNHKDTLANLGSPHPQNRLSVYFFRHSLITC